MYVFETSLISTTMPEFASLESQDVREYWEHEGQDFTPWLAEDIRTEGESELEDALGLDLEVIQEEKSVGRYNVDILAEVVDDNRNVVIENQLGSSDHDHLGKSLAYASGIDADIIVWIAPRFYDEHRDAMQWLNQNSREGVDLFAIRVEVWTIGESEPAVRLNPVVEPSEWKEKAKRSEGELSDTKQLQEEFWTEFRDAIEERNTPLSARKPKPQHWYSNPIGKAGFELSFVFNSRDNELRAELVIRDDEEAYWQLHEDREEIDAELDRDLVWNEPEETRAGKDRSKLMFTKQAEITDEDRWDEYIDWMLECGTQFHDVFYHRIQRL
jgi:hypothetical protein